MAMATRKRVWVHQYMTLIILETHIVPFDEEHVPNAEQGLSCQLTPRLDDHTYFDRQAVREKT
jgi:hypothetical protein